MRNSLTNGCSSVHHPVLAAIYDPLTWVADQTVFKPHREYLATDLTGRVLELGIGTGAMIPFLAPGVRNHELEYHAIEPDPSMRRRANAKAQNQSLQVSLTGGVGEQLPYQTAQFDAVLSAMVFCTVHNPEQTLNEVERVLKPGGEFRFLEHVNDTGWRSQLQSVVTPVWRRLAGGCHLTRSTVTLFQQSSSFEAIELNRVRIAIPPLSPFYRGRLRRC